MARKHKALFADFNRSGEIVVLSAINEQIQPGANKHHQYPEPLSCSGLRNLDGGEWSASLPGKHHQYPEPLSCSGLRNLDGGEWSA
jgi:hypothetical protein